MVKKKGTVGATVPFIVNHFLHGQENKFPKSIWYREPESNRHGREATGF